MCRNSQDWPLYSGSYMSFIRASLSSILIGLTTLVVVQPAVAVQDVVLPRLIVVMDSATTATQNATGLQIQNPLSSKSLKDISQVAGVNLNYGKQLWTQGHLVDLPANASAAQVADVVARIKQLPGIKAVTQDRLVKRAAVPNDPYYAAKPDFTGDPLASQYIATNGQWWLKKPQTLNDAAGGNLGAINAEAGWAITTGSNHVVVAVVDTGVRQLPEIRDRLLPGFDFVTANPFQNDPTFSKDGDGWDADPTDPGDYATQSEIDNTALPYDSQCLTSSWHGTFITGQIAAATNNSIGVAGLDWAAKVLPVRALGKCGFGSLSDILSAMRWAAGLAVNGVPTNNNPAKIINLSLGSGTCTTAEQQVVSELVSLGVSVVVAAGNNSSAPAAPADCKGVIAVGGNSRDGSKLRYSSYGTYTTLMAPGGSDGNPLYSTVNAGKTDPDSNDADSYRAEIGTSFSTPLVTGTISLMLAVNPNLKPGQIKALLEQSARPFPNNSQVTTRTCTAPNTDPDTSGDTKTPTGYCLCTKALCGAGILDVETTLQAITGNQPPVLATLPTLHVKSTDTVSFKVTAADAENDTVILSSDDLPAGATFDAVSGQFNWANPVAGTYFVPFYGADLGREARSKEVAIIYVTAATTTTNTTTTSTPTTTTSSSSGGGGAIGWIDLLLLIGLVAGAGCVKILINAYTGKGYH